MEWQEHTPWFWQRITFDDGSTERGPDPVFRRRVDGKWVYRRPTMDELRAWAKAAVW